MDWGLEKRGWKTASKTVANQDLWQQLDKLSQQRDVAGIGSKVMQDMLAMKKPTSWQT